MGFKYSTLKQSAANRFALIRKNSISQLILVKKIQKIPLPQRALKANRIRKYAAGRINLQT